jgi:hypothetical protein
MAKEYDIAVGKGKTHDARKSQPGAAAGGKREDTLMNFTAPKPKCGYLDPRKKVAKPAGTTTNQSTMI